MCCCEFVDWRLLGDVCLLEWVALVVCVVDAAIASCLFLYHDVLFLGMEGLGVG